jgi:NAD+ synthase
MRKRDLKKETERIAAFIFKQLAEAGLSELIVGLSGGIDSAVTAALGVKAVGREHVHIFLLPYRKSHSDSLEHGRLVADFLQVGFREIDISPMVDDYFDKYEPEAGLARRGNRMARERMCVLYDQSAKLGGLVAGTGNRSELLTGYVTIHGDGACAFEPLGHLYKMEVYELAKYLCIPEEIINKAPTADLWDGQTDEKEMGLRYEQLDEILYRLYELHENETSLIAAGLSRSNIAKVQKLIAKSEYKRHLPPQLGRLPE